MYGAGGIQGGYTKYNAENSVIIGHMGDAGCVSWGEGKHYVTYNGTITTPKNGFFSSKYGYYLLLQMDLRKYRGGSGLPFLTYDMLTEMSAIYAGDKNESRQIESILSNLDKLITLHQCKDFCRSKEKEFECIYNKDTKMTNDWEQRKLKEVANRYDNLRIPVAANLRKKGTTPYYGANGIQDYVEGYTHNGEYVLVAEDGANDLKNYPVKCVKGKIWVNNHAHVLQAISEIADNTFLTYSINQADIESLLVGGGRAKLNAEVLMGIELYFPSKEEQVIIGKYISDIDKLITLHRCKDFIPKYGKKFNMRYLKSKIKTNAWEQRKLGEIVERVVRKNINNESDLPLTISAQYGLVDQNTYFNNRVASRDVSNYYLVYNGEFAYNKSTSDGFPFGAVKRLDLYEKGVLSTLYIVFGIKNQNKVDSNYLTVFFDTDRWHKGVAERAAEGARNHGLLNISVDDFFDIDIKLPKDISEQELLGKVFYNLDKLITLHQRE